MQHTKQCYESAGNVCWRTLESLSKILVIHYFGRCRQYNSFFSEAAGYDAIVHPCFHGGLGDKLTRWWASVDWFLPLAVLCDKQHTHAPWNPEIKNGKTVDATHEEAAYPVLLRRRLADTAFEQALFRGAVQHDTLQEQIESSDTTAHRFLINVVLSWKVQTASIGVWLICGCHQRSEQPH